jgi:hypothetical protein
LEICPEVSFLGLYALLRIPLLFYFQQTTLNASVAKTVEKPEYKRDAGKDEGYPV